MTGSHPNQTVLYYLLITLPVVTGLTWLCIVYVDRPVAEWCYEWHNRLFVPPKDVADTGSIATYCCYVLALPLFMLYFLLRLNGWYNHFVACLKAISQSVVFAFFATHVLKFIFARPTVLAGSQLRFLADPDSYTFHLMQLHGSGESFPSGHMFMFTAVMVSLSLYYPLLRKPALILTAMLFAGLLFFNLHYLSDLITGTYLGTSLALGLYLIACQKRQK